MTARIAFFVLSLALLAGVVVGRETPTQQIIAKKTAQEPDFDLSRLEKREAGQPSNDPFGARSFGAPAAQQQQAAVQAKPEAPPLPFRYMGKVTEDGQTDVLLLRGDEHLVVRPGQKIDGEYRVDKVTASAVTFTYLPMKQKQTLELAP